MWDVQPSPTWGLNVIYVFQPYPNVLCLPTLFPRLRYGDQVFVVVIAHRHYRRGWLAPRGRPARVSLNVNVVGTSSRVPVFIAIHLIFDPVPHRQRVLRDRRFADVAHPPAWCEASRVPAFYRDVERQVTVPGAGINGALVCSLLLSSGLSRPVLGRIWELCSCTLAGSFTPTELYTALALVAVAQARRILCTLFGDTQLSQKNFHTKSALGVVYYGKNRHEQATC